MNATKTISVALGVVFLSATVILSTPGSALAAERRSPKSISRPAARPGPVSRPLPDRRDQDRRGIDVGRGKSHVEIRIGAPIVPLRQWVPGHYETRYEQVCVEPAHYEWRFEQVCVEPAHYETRYIPAVEETLYDRDGRPRRVVVEPAREERVYVQARYETRQVRVWVQARYETRAVLVHVPGYWMSGPAVRTFGGITIGGIIRF